MISKKIMGSLALVSVLISTLATAAMSIPEPQTSSGQAFGFFAGLGASYDSAAQLSGPNAFVLKLMDSSAVPSGVSEIDTDTVSATPMVHPNIQVGYYFEPWSTHSLWGVVVAYDAPQALSSMNFSANTQLASSSGKLPYALSKNKIDNIIDLFATFGRQFSWGDITIGAGPTVENLSEKLALYAIDPTTSAVDFNDNSALVSTSKTQWCFGGAVRLDVIKTLSRTWFFDVFDTYRYIPSIDATMSIRSSNAGFTGNTLPITVIAAIHGSSQINSLGIAVNKTFA